MSDEKRGSRVLRFAVSGALLIAPLAGCDGEEATINEPPEPTINEVVEQPTINEPPQEPPQPTINEPAEPSGPVLPGEPGTEAIGS